MAEGALQLRQPHRQCRGPRRNQTPPLRQGRRLDPPLRQEKRHAIIVHKPHILGRPRSCRVPASPERLPNSCLRSPHNRHGRNRGRQNPNLLQGFCNRQFVRI